MMLMNYVLIWALIPIGNSTIAQTPSPVVPVMRVQVFGSGATINPYEVLGPGDLIMGGRVIPGGPTRFASTTDRGPTLSPGDLGTLGMALPPGGLPPASSSGLQNTLGPGDLITGGALEHRAR